MTSETIVTILPFHLEWIYEEPSAVVFTIKLVRVRFTFCVIKTKLCFLLLDPLIPQLIMVCANTYVLSIRAWWYSDRRSMLIRNYSCIIQY